MRVIKFKDWGLFSKIAFISGLTMILLAICVSFFIVPAIETDIMTERRTGLANITETAVSLIADYSDRAAGGEMSRADAMAGAKQAVKALRYGENGKEYLFIIQAEDCHAVMHPIKPDLDGTDLSQVKDKKGNRLFAEMVTVCRENRQGVVSYFWPKPGSDTPVPKLTRVQLFEPWGWIVGTGVYIDDLEAKIAAIKTRIYTIVSVAILISLGMTVLVARKISTPIKRGVKFAETIATGDLTTELDIRQKDEVGILANSLNEMVKNLCDMFGGLSRNSDDISSSSAELAAISQQLYTNAARSSEKVSSIAAAIEEMNASVSSVSESAGQSMDSVESVAAAAQQMADTIREISRNTDQADTTTRQAVENVTDALKTMANLGSAAREIEKVTDTIYEISEQTNLLALNATIEAARAGEAGKGFAVVAAEIKDLAKQTTVATGEIDQQIKGIQGATSAAVERIREVSTIVNDVQEVISSVTAALREQSVSTEDIAGAANQVQQGIREINQNMAQLESSSNSITNDISNVNVNCEETSEGSQQVQKSAESLSEISAVLSQSVNRFQFS